MKASVYQILKFTLVASVVVTVSSAFADPTFTSITEKDFEDITKDFSANFTHNSMMGPSNMGKILGFQVGLVAAQTKADKTNDIVKRNSGSDLPNLYNAGVMGALGIPFGIAGEVVMMPKMSASGVSLSSTSLALKWNIDEVVPVLPVNVALRGVYSTANLKFDQTVSAVTSSVESKTNVSGVQLLISPKLPIFEPYAGVGMLTGSNDLSVSGSSIFDSSYSTSQSEKKSVTSTQILLGAEVSLLLLKFGVEYSQSFGANRYGLKLALGF